MVRRVQFLPSDRWYLRKKHFCQDCKTRLIVVKQKRVLNSNSSDFEKFAADLPPGQRGMLSGNVMFVWHELKCQQCLRHYSAAEMQLLEGLYVGNEGSSVNASLKKALLLFFFLAFLAILIFISVHS